MRWVGKAWRGHPRQTTLATPLWSTTPNGVGGEGLAGASPRQTSSATPLSLSTRSSQGWPLLAAHKLGQHPLFDLLDMALHRPYRRRAVTGLQGRHDRGMMVDREQSQRR